MINKDFVSRGEKVTYFSIPSFEDTGLVKHGFTSRIGGVSLRDYEGLNLGRKTDDDEDNVYLNYKSIFEEMCIDLSRIVISGQVHSDKIHIIKESDPVIGNLKENTLKGIDALITNQKNIPLVTFYADCTPLFFLDREKQVIALAHSGWRGTASKIGLKVINKMVEEFGCNPKDILSGIGPCIGSCCYEVDDPVIGKLKESVPDTNEYFKHKYDDKYDLDLTMANKNILLEAGLLEENISTAYLCTHCNKDLFYSYRRDKGTTGRMCAIMSLI